MKHKTKHSALNHLARLYTTCCFIGYSPWAPGTCASIVTCIIWYTLPPCSDFTMGLAATTMTMVGVLGSNLIIKQDNIDDPSYIVIDEAVGMLTALYALPKNIPVIILALFLFRLFDIVKPFPISWVQNNIYAGWGVMLDDILAGVIARICIYGLSLLFR